MRSYQLEMLTVHYRWIGGLGLSILMASSPFDGLGAMAGGMAVWLGACGGSFSQYRKEPGLWMASGLFLALSCAVLAFFTYALGEEIFRHGRVVLPSHTHYDFAVASLLLIVQILFLSSVTHVNWHLKKQRVTPEL